ncbi:hypothetical protein LCGC14_2916260, partial [marine sediment metagenome]
SWADVINKAKEWKKDLSQLEDEDVQPPNIETVDKAIELAGIYSKLGYEPPIRVLPTGDGGVAFEWDDRMEEFHCYRYKTP